MGIGSAKFIVSNSSVKGCPPPNKPEFAFIGRSNVGKSSLINMLCNHQGLAKVSQTPGKTQLINHFDINEGAWMLVDLPGYGFAKVPKGMRNSFHDLITGYISTRENLYCLFILIDSRIPPQKIDLDFIRYCGEQGIPFTLIFTKIDKQSKGKTQSNVEEFCNKMLEEWEELPTYLLSSAETREGRDEIINYIDEIIVSARNK